MMTEKNNLEDLTPTRANLATPPADVSQLLETMAAALKGYSVVNMGAWDYGERARKALAAYQVFKGGK